MRRIVRQIALSNIRPTRFNGFNERVLRDRRAGLLNPNAQQRDRPSSQSASAQRPRTWSWVLGVLALVGGIEAKRPEEIRLPARWRLVWKHFRTSSEPLRDFGQSWAQAGVTTDAAGSTAWRSPCFQRQQKRVDTELNDVLVAGTQANRSGPDTTRPSLEMEGTTEGPHQ
jgi:hypothetical protein